MPCLARNATELARRSARGDAALEGRIAAEGMRILGRAAEEGYTLPPPCYARQLIDNVLAMCDGAVPDPWAEEKRKSTELALKLIEGMGLFTNDNCHNCSQITNTSLKREMKLSEVYEAIGMMDVGIFIQSSRFWRDLDENPARND